MTPEEVGARFGLVPGNVCDIMLGLYPDEPFFREVQTVAIAGGWLKFTFKKHDEDKCNYGGYTLESLNATEEWHP